MGVSKSEGCILQWPWLSRAKLAGSFVERVGRMLLAVTLDESSFSIILAVKSANVLLPSKRES